jgi:hypothetical protein
MDISDKWLTLENGGGPIWGSRGREFKSRQPDRRADTRSSAIGVFELGPFLIDLSTICFSTLVHVAVAEMHISN